VLAFAKRWGWVVVVAVLALIAIRFIASWLSSDLGTIRVGPRPDVGRTVLILLHGYGASGDDLEGLADELSEAAPETTFLLLAGPHRVAVTGRAWVPDFQARSRAEYGVRLATEIESTNARVWEVIGDARDKGVSCRDIYVGGFSQGGRMAAEVVLRAPQDCDLGGVIVMSGGGMNEVELPSPEDRAPMRVLVTHGSRDPLVSIAKGLETAKHFSELGHDVQWLRFEGSHEIPAEVRRAIPAFLRGETVGEEAP